MKCRMMQQFYPMLFSGSWNILMSVFFLQQTGSISSFFKVSSVPKATMENTKIKVRRMLTALPSFATCLPPYSALAHKEE